MALAIIPYTLLAQGIYSGLIKAVSSITVGTCDIVKSIYTHRNPDVTRVVMELDIERKLCLIQAVLNYTNKYSNTESKPKTNYAKMKLNDLEKTQLFEIVGEEDSDEKDPIKLSLYYLHEIIQDIHNNLYDINKKTAYHNTKWFHSWRTLDINSYLNTLKINTKLLDRRFKDLTNISSFLYDISNKK